MIYVRSKEGSVLMPTERCGKIGYLLRHGKAHVVSRVPFVVQLDYDSTTYTQDGWVRNALSLEVLTEDQYCVI